MEKECKYKTTIGLEIHAELKTKTKMFCSCKNDPEEKSPNVNICSVCTAQPGTLPVLNKEAIKHVVRVGLACGSTIANFTEWDRKNYFYPDIPKGYQITQYKYPLVSEGYLNGVRLTRIHLEEDTAKSSHDQGDFSLVDFNRSGVPLMELVTEPVIHTAKDASNFAKELQLLLQYLGAGDANMEKGEMRVEANISVSDCDDKLGTKVEVKNLNSFRAVERAIAYEVERHIEVLERGEKIIQETRGWDESKQKTFSQRIKEDSHDYRYFPDPDLPKMMISEVFDLKELANRLPELPWQRRDRYVKVLNIKEQDAESFVSNIELGDFFEKVILNLSNNDLVKIASNYISSDLVGIMSKDSITEFPDSNKFASIITMISEGKISSRTAKDLLIRVVKDNIDPEEVAEKEGLIQKNDEDSLKIIIEKVISDNPKVLEDYRAGKETSLQFFIGQVIKITKGSANPQIIKKVLLSILS
ncbi:MAG: Asp-tRNA(Asn)/Glu-tRNA(Gln) amidotransferase subunit GatB [Candidatus Paceibacterota bacterium]|nr:Asp-tRNA(Asn)/Glu-tRNA(Gln) amidotransferase subunit GatB [Candidatus Paceibacterota bacterium]